MAATTTAGCNDETLPPKRDLRHVEDLGLEDLVAGPDVAVPGPAAGSVVINEVHASNVGGLADEDKEISDWIELYNPTSEAVDLTGVGLSDAVDRPFTWVFPPGAAIGPRQYLLIFASGKNRAVWGRPLHTGFTLNNGEDAVSLMAPGGVPLDYLPPSRAKVNISWCRMPDAVGPFTLCLAPTPAAMNGGIAFPSMLTPPSLSVVGGFYDTPQSVELSTFEPGAVVRYTLDSSEPTAGSPQYLAPIPVSAVHGAGTYKVTVIRAAAFADGKLSSPINTHTYIVDPNISSRYLTNVIAINVDPPQLTGPNGIITNATKGSYNNWADISASGSIEYYRADRSLAFRSDGTVKVAGQLSRTFPQKTFDVFFKDAYGTRSVNERIFPNRSYSRFRTFRLRDGGTDYKWAMMRDTLMGMAGIDMPSMPFSDHARAVVFLDGDYYGQMEVREHVKQDYLESVYGIDANAVDIVDVNGSLAAQQGTLEAFNAWWSWVGSHRADLASDFDLFRSVIDPETLANYLAIELYGNNIDWPGNNERFWHARTQDAPWKFSVNDLDLTLDCPFTGPGGPNANPFGRMAGGGYTATLFQIGVSNSTFKTYLVNVFADLMNTSFSQAVAESHFTTLMSEMTPLMPEFYARWPQNTVQGWMNETAKVIAYLRAREAGVVPRIQAQFGLVNQSRYLLTVNVNDVTMGTVQVNTVDLGLGGRLVDVSRPWTGRYFPNVPITVTAKPAPGHKFTGWQGATSSLQATETLNFNSDSAITATFAPDPMWKPPVKPQPTVPPAGMRNLALGGTATQSSIANGAHAGVAIDGDPSRAAAANSLAATNMELAPWWQVDLGQVADIYRIDLFTRVDMADFALFVSDADMSSKNYATLLADASVWQFVQKGPGYTQQARLVGRRGRYVRVQRGSTGSLGLAEVMVLGVPATTLVPDPSRLRNLALYKTATSSSDGGGAAPLALDGNADANPMARSTALTRAENTPWWEVDLGDQHTIGAVHIYAVSRPVNFTVLVSPQPMAGKSLAELEADPMVWKRQVTATMGSLLHLTAETMGRYVRVQRKDSNVSLGLAEVVVLGE